MLHLRRPLPGLLAALAVALAGAAWLAVARVNALHAAFETDARIVHRLLSQRVVQHDAILATLVLLQPAPADAPGATLARLPSVYPQILAVRARNADADWGGPDATALAAAEAASRSAQRPVMVNADLDRGRYGLLMAGAPASYLLQIDLQAAVPWDEWPMDRAAHRGRFALEADGRQWPLQPGQASGAGWTARFHKTLAAASQPLAVVAERRVGWDELPWARMALWCAATAAGWALLAALGRQRAARRRAEDLLRMGQAARLNTLGELAAGMAHELNQPLTALLASTQAARRLLAEPAPDWDTARNALDRAVDQARRASAVVGRLRRLVERPDLAAHPQALPADAAVAEALHLLAPECAQRQVRCEVQAAPALPAVLADPVALQQILHNLLTNALQALEAVPPAQRRIDVHLQPAPGPAVAITVRDHGPGVPADARGRLFEPFYSTRPGGLGLGLSLCESLAQAQGGRLELAPADGPGAAFVLTLPAAATATPTPTATPPLP